MARGNYPSIDEMKLYLAEQGIMTESRNETYVRRLYRGIRQQEESGLTPSRTQARGKEKQQFTYHQPSDGMFFPYWEVRSIEGLQQLVKRTSHKTHYTFYIHGIANGDSPTRKKQRDANEPLWLSVGGVPREYVIDSVNSVELDGGDLTDFANDIAQYEQEWKDVDIIQIVDRTQTYARK